MVGIHFEVGCVFGIAIYGRERAEFVQVVPLQRKLLEFGECHSHGLWFDRPFTWETLNAALQALTALRGPDLLRVKGIVNVEGETGPVVLQGAQHVFHPPVTMAGWTSGERRSRIVFIVRNIKRASIEALFSAVASLG